MKQKKTLRVLLTLALALTMCLGSFTTAFAAPADMLSGTESDPVNTVIAKEFKMAEGTITPSVTFTFNFAKKSVDATTVTDASDPTNTLMPAVAAKSVSFTSADTATAIGGVITLTKDTTSLFNIADFTHAGVYTYTVTETTGSAAGVTYSKAEYDVAVYIANGASGLYIAGVGTTIKKDNDGNASSGKTSTTTPGSVTGTFRAMTFSNSYVKGGGGGDPKVPADQELAISKTVSGNYADKTKYFPYTVTVNKTSFGTTSTYKGYVVENGAVVTAAANGTVGGTDANGAYINFPSGTGTTVNLKHGQTLAFVDTEVGVTYVANELGAADYTPSYIVTTDGTAAAAQTGTVGTALSTGTQSIVESATPGTGVPLNGAAFTNTYKTVTPTGISLNNLPFIMMIVLAAVALVGFVAVKSRKKTYSN